jgi:phage major head subunit gpT-like protein
LHKAIAETAYSVDNKLWETTLDVPRTSMEDDAFGHYAAIAEGHGEAVDDLRSALIFGALNGGFAAVCYDGQFFFDTDHPVAPNEDGTGTPATQSNYQAGTAEPWYLLCNKRAARPIYLQERTKPEFYSAMSLDSPLVFDYDTYSFGSRYRANAAYGFWQCAHGSKATFSEANFDLMYNAIQTRLGDGNRKLGLVPDMMVVGPTNRAAAEKLILAKDLASGATNTNYQRVELIVSPWVA